MSPKAGTLYVLTDRPVDPHRWACQLPDNSTGFTGYERVHLPILIRYIVKRLDVSFTFGPCLRSSAYEHGLFRMPRRLSIHEK